MSDSIFIKSIHIRGMFDMYEYNIHIPEDNRVSLLIGPNGFGKTKILETINRFCHNDYTTDYPVKKFNIVLSDKTDMDLSRRKEPLPISPISSTFISPEADDIFPLSVALNRNMPMYLERCVDYTDLLNDGLRYDTIDIDYNPNNWNRTEFNKLSSGFKWIIQLWYQILFSEDKNRLILIDVPETFMHIRTQEKFLDHLIEMCDKYDMRAIVVTHSPYIVSSHANLVLNKYGPRYKRKNFKEFKNI
jgi:predicted ATP-dependent endonuclease of OLD family